MKVFLGVALVGHGRNTQTCMTCLLFSPVSINSRHHCVWTHVTNIAEPKKGEFVCDSTPCFGKEVEETLSFLLASNVSSCVVKSSLCKKSLSLLAGGGKRCEPRNNSANLSKKKVYPMSEETAEGVKSL